MNIFLFLYIFSVDHQTTDSGAASGDFSPQQSRHSPEAGAGGWSSSDSSPGDFEKVHYKIGDLGHVDLVGDGLEVAVLIELDLVVDHPGADLLVTAPLGAPA